MSTFIPGIPWYPALFSLFYGLIGGACRRNVALVINVVFRLRRPIIILTMWTTPPTRGGASCFIVVPLNRLHQAFIWRVPRLYIVSDCLKTLSSDLALVWFFRSNVFIQHFLKVALIPAHKGRGFPASLYKVKTPWLQYLSDLSIWITVSVYSFLQLLLDTHASNVSPGCSIFQSDCFHGPSICLRSFIYAHYRPA